MSERYIYVPETSYGFTVAKPMVVAPAPVPLIEPRERAEIERRYKRRIGNELAFLSSPQGRAILDAQIRRDRRNAKRLRSRSAAASPSPGGA